LFNAQWVLQDDVMHRFDHWPYPRFVAHRGAGILAPENTLAAMRLGASYGYRMVEFDVKLSSDDQAFLLHDATLERTTNGRGTAGALSLAELTALDAGAWHSARFAGEPIPSLAQLAQWALAHQVLVNIEIKPTPGQEERTGRLVADAAQQLWAQASTAPLLSSFSPVALEAARAAQPNLPRALLVERLPADWLQQCRALDCIGIDPNWRSVDAQMIAQAHAHGLRVLSYTINDPVVAQKLLAAGLDCLITDAVDVIAPTE
jgi:glycerophosphoryl diester phosphodiesterase